MGQETLGSLKLQCLNCGFDAPSEEWDQVEHEPLGTLTRCPECGSTDVHSPVRR